MRDKKDRDRTAKRNSGPVKKIDRADRVDRTPSRVKEDYPPNANIIYGRNPVMEAIKSGRTIDKILVSGREGSLQKILAMAKDRNLVIRNSDRVTLDRLAEGGAHQGILCFTSQWTYTTVEDILKVAKDRGEDPFILILDRIEDPHNLGAIMRTAECAGAHGIIIPKDKACGLTETVAKASAGAIEYMPCAKVTNLATTIDELKDAGLWIYACDMGENLYYEADLKGPIALVIGSEGRGISRLIKEKCDFTLSIPMVGKINSLNASNAAAILIYEVRRKRDGK